MIGCRSLEGVSPLFIGSLSVGGCWTVQGCSGLQGCALSTSAIGCAMMFAVHITTTRSPSLDWQKPTPISAQVLTLYVIPHLLSFALHIPWCLLLCCATGERLGGLSLASRARRTLHQSSGGTMPGRSTDSSKP